MASNCLPGTAKLDQLVESLSRRQKKFIQQKKKTFTYVPSLRMSLHVFSHDKAPLSCQKEKCVRSIFDLYAARVELC